MHFLSKILLTAVIALVLFILILPVGIRTGVDFVSFGPTSEEERTQNKLNGLTSDTNKTEVRCKYFVRTGIESIPTWRYSDDTVPNPPNCEFLSFYWHDGWFISPGTIWF